MFIHSIGKRIKSNSDVKIFLSSETTQKLNLEETSKFTDRDKNRIERTYFPNGQLKSECCFHNNLLQGLSHFYYESGRVKAVYNYHCSKLDGVCKEYYESGEIKSEKIYRMGHLLIETSYE